MPNNLPLKVTDALADLFLRSLPDGATCDEVSDLLDDRRVLLARVAELEAVIERVGLGLEHPATAARRVLYPPSLTPSELTVTP